MYRYDQDFAATLIVALVLSAAFVVFVLAFMLIVMGRLRAMSEGLALLNRHMAAMRYPNAGWPPPDEDLILQETRAGVPHRLFGDGRWEVFWQNQWVERPGPMPERRSRWRLF